MINKYLTPIVTLLDVEIGTGTVAEGWIKDAIDFWRDNMKQESNSGVPPVFAD